MGSNTSNSSQYGFVYVKTDNPVYMAGDLVTGTVHLNLISPFPANTISLQIKGQQKTFWRQEHRTNNNNDGINSTYYINQGGKCTLYKNQVIIYQFSNISTLPIGQYSFPFSFVLPHTLPGSFFERNIDFQGQIRYTVSAICWGPSMGVLYPIKHKAEIIIREPLKSQVQALSGELEVFPKTWCFFSQGSSKIRCFFEKNCYLPGETAHIMTEVDNTKCSLAVDRIECTFTKELVFYSNQGGSYPYRKTELLNQFEFPGVMAGGVAIGSSVKKTDISLMSNNFPINPTTNGKLITCNYFVEVRAVLQGCTCCSELPRVQAHIDIIAPSNPNFGQQVPPPNWNPQVFKPINFNVPPAPENYQENNQEINNNPNNVPNAPPPPPTFGNPPPYQPQNNGPFNYNYPSQEMENPAYQ